MMRKLKNLMTRSMKTVTAKRLPCAIIAVDVGAYMGVSYGLPELKPYAKDVDVIAFEPNDKEAKKLIETETGWKSFKCHASALGMGGKQSFYFLPNRPGASSVYEPDSAMFFSFPIYKKKWADSFDGIETRIVQTVTLDSIVKRADIIKIDTQGSELDILKGGERVVEGATAVKLEVEFLPFYKDQPLFPEIVGWMDEHGFTLNSIDIKKQHRRGIEPVWSDCLFVKRKRDDSERTKAVLQVFDLL